ncbi:DUF4382 domain-containing protein [Aureispira sp. CCB-E]|uniref:DUF4382 domain-containing protein n=2 Tax=unclassified Aureispira TaxID=2649989 RepID=UPI0006984512|nr:DUF4382 domain-containing protein [Aureispira sp. CCB-E]WMX15540.1 DUF4382 domain-containing protein [Aureispira sp. CCB-E]
MLKMKYLLMFAVCSFAFVQCTQDSDTQEEQKEVSIQLTDAPIDDADVDAVFITVAEVKVDGQTFSGFSGKKTINVKALQNGSVDALGTADLDAKAYSNITLVLDLDTDAQGNAMGCYIERANGTKESLAGSATGTIEVTSQGAIDLATETRSSVEVVLDFDLRKAIKNGANNNDYDFVSSAELSSSVRTVVKHETGTVKGSTTNNSGSNNDKVVAYIYTKGSYSSSEKNPQGTSNIRFKNAVSSSVVDANGDFQLSYLKDGEYDVVFASYEYDAQNKAVFKGTLEIGGLLSGTVLGAVTVNAQAQASLNFDFTALIL